VLPLQRAATPGRRPPGDRKRIYQIRLDDERSDYYRLEAVPDAPPW
jgi:hypothetical protein